MVSIFLILAKPIGFSWKSGVRRAHFGTAIKNSKLTKCHVVSSKLVNRVKSCVKK